MKSYFGRLFDKLLWIVGFVILFIGGSWVYVKYDKMANYEQVTAKVSNIKLLCHLHKV